MARLIRLRDIVHEVPNCPSCGSKRPFVHTANDAGARGVFRCADCGEDISAVYRYLTDRRST